MWTPIRQLKGIGEKTEQILADMKIYNYYDLCNAFPVGYDSFHGLSASAELHEGIFAYVRVKIVSKPVLKYFRKISLLSFMVEDEKGGHLAIRFFRQPYLAKVMQPGHQMIVKGKPQWKEGRWEFINPSVLKEEDLLALQQNPLIPRYSLKKGITEAKFRKIVMAALQECHEKNLWAEYLPDSVLTEYELLSLPEAYEKIHFPLTEAERLAARKRLIFDEFYFFQYGSEQKEVYLNEVIISQTEQTTRFLRSLPYVLTADQEETLRQIEADMKGLQRMERLVQGDVGSGKTLIAMAAALMVIENGFQVAMMAPTEVLAIQHFEAISGLSGFGVKSALLLGSMTAKEKREIYDAMQSGAIDFIIGTHALIQEKAKYHNLGLVITDEQHRFGVMQREMLSQKGKCHPHILVMSATPIPRTLALILYQDMKISTIYTMPAARFPIRSFLRDTSAREAIYRFIEAEIAKGAAAYIICPSIENNEELELAGVLDYAENLQKQFPNWKIAYLYGSQAEKEGVMQDFVEGRTDVLVSTTVVEVGVHVPRATVMLIENAERFGLAQLHQLRGRVGRGNRQSYCIFLTDSKEKRAMDKLEFITNHASGFEVAEYDLKMRGAGDAYGVRQHGVPMLKLADLYSDLPMLEIVQKAKHEIPESEEIRTLAELSGNSQKRILSL